jgi:hypothetical protein
MKKIIKSARTGELGINLIQRIVVHDLGCMWYPTGGTEAGIDGTIELLNADTDEATTQIISVQSKAFSTFIGETAETFEYVCKQRDLDYWLQGNTPVILVCSRPSTGEAYWVSIKDYFRDKGARASKKVVFNKNTDRFDREARAALEKLAIPQDSGLYLGATPREETVFSDLLPVRSLPPRIYTARTGFESRKAIFSDAGTHHSLSGCWTVHGRVIYSFEDLNSRAWKSYCEIGSIEEHPTSLLADSETPATKKIFVELLNFTLKSQLYDQDLGYCDAGYFYQKPDASLGQRTATYNSRLKKATRVMFSAYTNRDGSAVSFYRHTAFRAQFYRFHGKWFLQVIPTYHFTSDGYRISPLAGAALSGIKRLENNEAVYGQVLMWARILQQQTDWDAKPRKLFFADPLKFQSSAGFEDEVWLKQQPTIEEAESASEGENLVEAGS